MDVCVPAVTVQWADERTVQPWSKWQYLLHHWRRRFHHQNCSAQRGRVSAETAAWLLHGECGTCIYIVFHTWRLKMKTENAGRSKIVNVVNLRLSSHWLLMFFYYLVLFGSVFCNESLCKYLLYSTDSSAVTVSGCHTDNFPCVYFHLPGLLQLSAIWHHETLNYLKLSAFMFNVVYGLTTPYLLGHMHSRLT